ncbi:hypothetical protein GCM10023116_18170 [Kistimonas scapharcae]|uniref:Flagellar biosynthesis protein FlgN n=1 Tax=Kistimonas scapharcae TaxID=1036133 RepID=A0ABP8V024_9GAMM
MTTTASDSTLTALRQTNRLLTRMEQLLEQQYQYLLARDMASLEQESSRLSGLIEELETDASQRNQLLTSQGLTTDMAGMNQWITGLPAEVQDDARELWTTIRKQMVRCREMNLMNGRLQGRLRSATARLVELFWGNSVAQPGYNQGGQLERASRPRNIDRA